MTEPLKWAYTKKVKEHFVNPRNVLEEESSYKEDGKGVVGNVNCGDQMFMAIKVDKDSRRITDCKWKTYGCASAIASTSVLSERVKGMKLDDAYRLSPKDILKDLEGLPEHKVHCSVLGDKALRAAIDDYYKRNGIDNPQKQESARTVCQCMNVTDKEIEQAVRQGVKTYQQLQENTKLGTVCGQCKPEAEKLLKQYENKYSKQKGR